MPGGRDGRRLLVSLSLSVFVFFFFFGDFILRVRCVCQESEDS